MPSENNVKVKSKRSRCSELCFCPIAKKRKSPEIMDDPEQEKNLPPTQDEVPVYVDDLPSDIGPGTCITVEGIIKPDCARFSINFCTSKNSSSDIAFHMNPRLSMRYIVRTTRIDNNWGKEETSAVTKFDLERRKKFVFDIVTTDKEFLVSLNGKHFCAFIYRMPLTKVKAIRIEGSVEIQSVKYKKVTTYPLDDPQHAAFIVPLGSGLNKIPTDKMDIPVIATLPKGFREGWQLEIYGRVKIFPNTFYINLQNNSHLWPHPDIYLHLNARFNTLLGNHTLVRNSWINGSWGNEERSACNAFMPDFNFSVAIRKESDRFVIWIDGKMSGEYKFQGTTDNISVVYIHGDIDVYTIYMKDKIDDKYFLCNSGEVTSL